MKSAYYSVRIETNYKYQANDQWVGLRLLIFAHSRSRTVLPVLYSLGLDLSGFRLATFHIREKVLRICVSREGSHSMFFILGHKKKGLLC